MPCRRIVKLDVKGFSRRTGKFTNIGAGDIVWADVRQALVDISDFLSFCKEARTKPSPVIGEVLQLKGTRAVGVSEELWARIERLLELIRSLQSAYRDVVGITSRLEGQIEALREDYENLLLSFKREKEIRE